jgi:hypothetical protein
MPQAGSDPMNGFSDPVLASWSAVSLPGTHISWTLWCSASCMRDWWQLCLGSLHCPVLRDLPQFTVFCLCVQYPLVWKYAWHFLLCGVLFCFWWGSSVWTAMFCRYSVWYIWLLLAVGSISKQKSDKR